MSDKKEQVDKRGYLRSRIYPKGNGGLAERKDARGRMEVGTNFSGGRKFEVGGGNRKQVSPRLHSPS